MEASQAANRLPVEVAAIAAQVGAEWDLGPVVAEVAAIAAQEVEVAEVASVAVAAVAAVVALAVDQVDREAVRAGVETASCHGGASAAFAWTKSSM